MRVAALAPIAAMLVAVANAAPVPNADPFFCLFGWGLGCDSPATSSVKASSTSTGAVKTTIASTTIKASSSSTRAATSTKASSVVASSTKASTTTSVANWTWLWDPTYIFNMWNNFNAFRWDKYNDCSFNGYSLAYVKAWYYQTYGFKPLNGCQWNDVHTFLAKYAVKTSVVPASTQKYTPGCANPFGGADFNWKPASSSVPISVSTPIVKIGSTSSAAPTTKASSSSVQASSAAATSKASSVVVSSSSVATSSNAVSSQAASSQSASSQAASSQVVSTQAASSQVASSQAAPSQASSSVVQSSVVASQSAVESSVAPSQVASSSVDASPAQATNSATDGPVGAFSVTSASEVATSTDSALAAPTSTVVTNSGIKGTPITLSNGRAAQDLGCVAEVDGRKFKAASFDSPDGMTNEWCSNWCFNLGYPISGTEYAKECYCAGVSAMDSWTVSDQCVMPCSADSSEICGGPQALSVTYSPDAVRTVSLPANWVDKGCYEDNSSRVLTYQAWSGKSDSTLESCAAQCASLGYTIAGAEYGSECYCGNDFVGGPVAIDSGRCNMPCPGNGGTQCGGSFSLTVASSKNF